MSAHAIRKKKIRLTSLVHYLVLVILAIIVIYPIYFAFSYTFMTPQEVSTATPNFFPNSLYLENIKEVLATTPILRFILNSFIISIAVMIGEIITGSLAAYAFAFVRFKGRNIIFALFLATLMVPSEVTLIPRYLMMQAFGWMDTYQGLIVPHLATVFGIFLLRQFFMQLPKELMEAARMDGAGHLRIFLTIILPLSRPAIGTLGVYSFLNTWNQYLWPLLMTNSEEMRPVQIGITMLQDEEFMSWNIVLAGVTIALIPSLLLLVFGLKQLVAGITAGAVKQ
ncbi:carbohydrate ABC transporter permease [Aquibacillus koreensis]|uniref:Carbohydrate ABC transporter permease n=1 Tax=Aquibacillus koreensis TaxID=279446 RepID=A0A9X3WMC1_9BACI|nr:carbohydrate ABC transporter permease [Aquibacillus koreensis]MCT2537118.1 carbohydrate ABC transporter permease [Aquibacillus koreensis]MDC3419899.1 carbohydrate ABC transporter permease [Aquibacillus koreensis]